MYQNILVPVALDHNANIDNALQVAQALNSEGGSITLLYVTEPMFAPASQYVPDGVLAENRQKSIADLAEMAGGVRNAKTKVLTGSPGMVITQHAEEKGFDLIVVASHRPGLQDYFLGSTAARVVRHAKCAVHVVR